MKKISINNVPLSIKDYYCCPCDSSFDSIEGADYFLQDDPRLWLYIIVTSKCNAACPFCANGKRGLTENVDLIKYRNTLEIAAPYVSGVSFTGGEPMLDPLLLCTMIGIADQVLDKNVEFDMVTNGTNLNMIPAMPVLNRLSSIHISRHSVDDDNNRSLMMWNDAPGWDSIRKMMSEMFDPGAVVLNCVLQKGGVQDMNDVCSYLDKAIGAGIQNTSFITMMPANSFCIENYVSPETFDIAIEDYVEAFNQTHDSRIAVWNRMRDHEYCKCFSGSYESERGRTRFYFRCPGDSGSPDYCRQLVYTADNVLQDGFGDNRTRIL